MRSGPRRVPSRGDAALLPLSLSAPSLPAPRVGLVSSSLDGWPAPTLDPRAPLDATVVLPGSKSLTNRYLVLAALADGPSVLRSPLRSRDTHLMVGALQALGAVVEDGDAGAWHVTPGTRRAGGTVDCGLAGTVLRFVPPLAALAHGPTTFVGDPGASVRPLAPLLDALVDLGAEITRPTQGSVPFTVHGSGGLTGGSVILDASASSQFVSALLLSAPAMRDGLDLRVDGPMPSAPHVAMTVAVLTDAGVDVERGDGAWRVAPGPVSPLDVDVEPDLSNAAPFLAAAALAPEGGRVRVPGWPERTTQAGDALRDLLDAMGADVDLGRDGLTVTSSGELHGIDADLSDVGELTPVIAALAALAVSSSHLHGIGHLRGHETDRLAALVAEINALGGQAAETADGLRITPRRLHAGRVATYADHRMATAAAVLGLRVPGVVVEDVGTTSKTMPNFPDAWAAMLERT